MNLDQLQQDNQELSILNTIAQQLNREVTLQKALELTLQETVQLLDLKTAWIWFSTSAYQKRPFLLPIIIFLPY